jgi:hypothetical protein
VAAGQLWHRTNVVSFGVALNDDVEFSRHRLFATSVSLYAAAGRVSQFRIGRALHPLLLTLDAAAGIRADVSRFEFLKLTYTGGLAGKAG